MPRFVSVHSVFLSPPHLSSSPDLPRRCRKSVLISLIKDFLPEKRLYSIAVNLRRCITLRVPVVLAAHH
jgi:hypothetical protein